MRKTSQAELLPAAQARASASSSTRRVSRRVRASASVFPAGKYFLATSHRISAKDSQVRPTFSQPLFVCNSTSRPATADSTAAEIGFVVRIKRRKYENHPDVTRKRSRNGSHRTQESLGAKAQRKYTALTQAWKACSTQYLKGLPHPLTSKA